MLGPAVIFPIRMYIAICSVPLTSTLQQERKLHLELNIFCGFTTQNLHVKKKMIMKAYYTFIGNESKYQTYTSRVQ